MPIASRPELPDLPVRASLPELLAGLAAHRQALLVAPPGAGKSTLVPLSLLDAPWLAGGRMLMLEPRRLAARAVATRMAALCGERVGGLVGYRMRMERRLSRHTRLEVVTEGMLTRLLQRDPALEGIGCVIFDEFHERSLQADLGLALVLDLQQHLRPELRILIMSATLDSSALRARLPAAVLVSSEGRSFPVTTRYLERNSEEPLPRQVAAAIQRTLAQESGDLLCFLPGSAEIRRVASLLAPMVAGQAVRILPLYGELGQAAQDAALQADPAGWRRLILATNIAETSLTIEGIRIVIDSGFERRPRFDPRSGMSGLALVRIARSAADQRRGRAGRLGPGICLRLWTEATQRQLADQRPAEISEADLAPLALELACWGSDPGSLLWLDPPPAGALAQARELLEELGALDSTGRVTSHGHAMAALGMHPRLAHMLLMARRAGLAGTAAALAALLSGRRLAEPGQGMRDANLQVQLRLLDRAPANATTDRNALQMARRSRDYFLRQLGSSKAAVQPDAAGRLLALAWPERIAKRRSQDQDRYLLRSGRGARFVGPQPLAGEEFIVAADLDDSEREARIFAAAPLARSELEAQFAARIEERTRIWWDDASGAVLARRQRWLDALLLNDEPLPGPDPEQLREALLDGLAGRGLDLLPWTAASRTLRQRIMLARQLEPAGNWPDLGDQALSATLPVWLGPWLDGVSRLAHLARLDLSAVLRALLAHEQQSRLDQLLPTHIQVPSGSRIALDYLDGPEPVLAVRLQEVFGLESTPLIAGGRLPLTLKLLSPARRPVQITRDLASFWTTTYAEVRKELKGRYPKHYWPEDPRQAEPTSRVRPRPGQGSR